jgi:UDP-glucose 4-epimerase
VANAYGERQRVASAQGVVAVFLGRALRGEVVEIWGDGSVVRDYVYAGDVASSLIKAAVNTGDETLFNIGTGKGHSVNEVLAMIERVIGRPVVRTYRPARGLDVPVNVLDISRARRELGWEPQVAFEEGLARTADWIRCQPA